MAVAAKKYVELINDAMGEAGVDTQPIIEANGPDPLIPLHARFAKWVKRAWLEIQMSRSDWDWKVQTDIITLYPRIMIRTAAGSSIVANVAAAGVGATFRTADGEWSHTIRSIKSAREAGPVDTVFDYWFVDLETVHPTRVTDYPELGGVLTLYDSAGLATIYSVMFISYGKYDLEQEHSRLFNASVLSMDLVIPGTGTATYFPIQSYTSPFPYSATVVYNGNSYGAFTDADGFLVFYHPLTEAVNVRLMYEPRPQELVLMADTPQGLDPEFHDAIMWRAVMHYAEYDKRSPLFMTAKQQFKFYESQIDKRHLPRVGFAGNKI